MPYINYQGKEDILNPRPGETKVYVSAWLFIDSKQCHGILEAWTHLEGMIELTNILKQSPAIKRAVVSKHAFYDPNKKEGDSNASSLD